ncbi:MAG: DUF1611 domain-containing protein [Bacteroidota bacterium]
MDQPHISGKAVIITGGLLNSNNAKTAHGLLRGTDRFEIIGVIDENSAGQDAGLVVAEKPMGVPVKADITEFIEQVEKPEFAIIGMATKGGVLPKDLYPSIHKILSQGIQLVNGLHQPLSEIAEFGEAAAPHGEIIHDIRRSKAFHDLHFWTGEIQNITSKRIAVLGTDCALGKRTTSKMLADALNARGVKSEMIYTGQTGWMQGAHYGFLFDATPNDFVCGELEHAMVECWKNLEPEVMVMEGQASLRNPSGPCGSEFIISGAAEGVILQHAPVRSKFKGMESYPADIPDILDEAALIEKLGSPVIGFTINTEKMDDSAIESYRKELTARTDLPVVFPFKESLDPIAEAVIELKK